MSETSTAFAALKGRPAPGTAELRPAGRLGGLLGAVVGTSRWSPDSERAKGSDRGWPMIWRVIRDEYVHAKPDPDAAPATAQVFDTEESRVASFKAALDELRAEVDRDLGEKDVDYSLAAETVIRALEWGGRAAIALSIEPLTFGCGVLALSAAKLWSFSEGHAMAHGTYVRWRERPDMAKRQPGTFDWLAPVDTRKWQPHHNRDHHREPNLVGADLDLIMIESSGKPTEPGARNPLALNLAIRAFQAVFITDLIALMVSVGDALEPVHKEQLLRIPFERLEDMRADVIDALKPFYRDAALRRGIVTFLKKYLAYYGREYLLYPAAAGPLFPKVLLGNVLSEVLRALLFGAASYCNHVGRDTPIFVEEARSSEERMLRQVLASNNLATHPLLSILLGDSAYQIEHHVAPDWSTARCRENASKIRAICERHGVPYKSGTLRQRMREVYKALRDGPIYE